MQHWKFSVRKGIIKQPPMKLRKGRRFPLAVCIPILLPIKGIEKIMTDWEQARELFKTGDYSCVLCRDGVVYTSTKNGIAPLVEWLTGGSTINGFSAADKIVGKAAALLFILGGVKEVYAAVMSETAAETLAKHGITAYWDKQVSYIVNREGTGPCPMEQAVTGIDDPAKALAAIQDKMAALRAK